MKKIYLLSILAFCFFYNTLNAQQWLWVKALGGTNIDYAHDVATDLSGNVFVTGSYEGTGSFGTIQLTNSGLKDAFIAKLNNQGVVQWAKKGGGTGNEEGLGVAIDADGDCYITGYFTGTVTFGTTNLTSSNGKDIFFAKYDGSNGNLIWAKKIGVTGDAEGAGIAVDTAGNIYITGYFRNTATFKPTPNSITLTASGGLDAFVAKFNDTGTCLWARKGGGSLLDRAYSIAVEGENVVITGYYEDNATFGSIQLTSAGSGDAFVALYETDGTFSWAKTLGGLYTDYGQAVAIDTSGNVYFSGLFEVQAGIQSQTITSNGGYDIFLAKLNKNGTLNWVKNFGGQYIDYTKSMKLNNYYDAIYFTGAYAIESHFDSFTLTSPTNSQDVFVAKADTSGAILWITGGGGIYDDDGNGIAVDAYGVVYVAGRFYNNTTTFGTLNVTGYGDYDGFLGKICPLSAIVVKNNVSCHGQNDGSIIIIPDGGTPPFSYVWSPNIGTTDTIENLSAGIYNVTVSDDNGCEVLLQIEIEEPLAMVLNTSTHNILCHNDNNGYASVNVSGGTLPLSYSWNTIPEQTNDTAFNLAQGTYKVIVTDGSGCKDSIAVNILNPPLINAFAGQDKSVCASNAVTIGATPAATGGTPPYNYLWSPSTYLNNDTLANPVATPTNAVTYTLLVTDNNGCTATDIMNIAITQPPAVMISQSDTLCVGETTNLAANASGALSYAWSPAASLNNANIQTPVASPLQTTTYTVTVTFAGNCYNTNNVKIVVNNLPQIVTSGNQSVCHGDSLVLSASGGNTYLWQPSGLLYNNTLSAPQTYPLTQNANFSVTVTNANGCQNTASLSITVNPLPTPIIIENNGILSSNYALGNQWYLNGATILNQTGQNYTPTQDGDYYVIVTVNNCSGTSNTITMTNVNISELLPHHQFIIFPNPASGVIRILSTTSEDENVKFIIKDVLGKTLISDNIIINNIKSSSIDIQFLNTGIYFIEIQSKLYNFTQKIVKQ